MDDAIAEALLFQDDGGQPLWNPIGILGTIGKTFPIMMKKIPKIVAY
jgi:hypothetical protein